MTIGYQDGGNDAMFARGTSWRCLALLICCCCLQIGTVSQATAQGSANDRNAYFLGTASTGGAYHPVGVALSTLIKLKLLPEFDVDLTAINTNGSEQNVELIRRDDIQFAIISALAGHEARAGTGQFEAIGPDENLRAITTLWLSTDHLLVRGDAVQSGTINDFVGLRGRPVSLGRQESGTLLQNRALMSALGVDINSDFELIELGYGESAEALASGQIDGMSVSGGVPIGAVQDVFERLGEDVVALDIDDDQLRAIDGGRRIWQRVVIPSGTYPGQTRDIFTVGAPNILAVRADVDEEVVYRITKTIFEELDYLHGLHSTTRQISLANAVSGLPLPVHPGAERYFAEAGVELPPPPVEIDSDLLTRYPSVEAARTAANAGTVTMYAGTEGDTSTRIAAELAATLSSADDGVRLLATNGGGIGRNLTDLLYLKGVDTALVRADLLNYAEDQEVYPAVRNQVNYIAEMFPEEVHLLVGGSIAGLEDLAGKTINFGSPGSGTDITASVVLSKLGLNAEPAFLEPRVAIEQLKRGEIQGAFFVGGKPMPLLQQIDDASGLKLLSLPAVDYFDSYDSAELSGRDYPNLMSSDETVPTIAARTMLMTYAWRPESVRYDALGNLTGALFGNLLALHDDGHHPKWREVDPAAEFEGWRRFEPASRWLDDNQGTARRIAEEARLRLELQNANVDSIGAGGGEPQLIENDADEVVQPAPSEVPAAPLGTSASTTTEPVGRQPDASNGAAFGGSTGQTNAPPAARLPSVPTTGVNSPTF